MGNDSWDLMGSSEKRGICGRRCNGNISARKDEGFRE